MCPSLKQVHVYAYSELARTPVERGICNGDTWLQYIGIPIGNQENKIYSCVSDESDLLSAIVPVVMGLLDKPSVNAATAAAEALSFISKSNHGTEAILADEPVPLLLKTALQARGDVTQGSYHSPCGRLIAF